MSPGAASVLAALRERPTRDMGDLRQRAGLPLVRDVSRAMDELYAARNGRLVVSR